jgi:hypothetical protein
MTMSLNQPKTQALGSIADGLAGSDPGLASMLNVFSRLAADEEMPARERPERGAGGRPPAVRARRHPRRGTAFPQPRRLYPWLGLQQAMLLLGAVIAAGVTDCSRQWHSRSFSRAKTTWRCEAMVAGFRN